jgi:uncharacterized membrane protein
VDGIVLHQILQWHHMLSDVRGHPATTVAGLESNTLADGLFHAATWLAVVAGLVLLWRVGRRGRLPGRALLGLTLAGWGLFNLVEGIVDHHVLGLHHVRPGEQQTLFDLGFLALGFALLAGGGLLARSAPSGEVRA